MWKTFGYGKQGEEETQLQHIEDRFNSNKKKEWLTQKEKRAHKKDEVPTIILGSRFASSSNNDNKIAER